MHRIAYFKTPPQTGELVYPSPPGAVGIAEKSQGVVGAHCKGGNTSLELQQQRLALGFYLRRNVTCFIQTDVRNAFAPRFA